MKIEKVAVIGAGVMGSGIAAHVANAGFNVTLLDIVPEGAENRNIITEMAVKKMLKPVKNVNCVILEVMQYLELVMKMQMLFLSVRHLEKVKTFVVSPLSVLQEKGLMMH